MINYFGEKLQQVEPKVMDAFGIRIESRYGNADEIMEMIELAKCFNIINIFYDSKAGICNIERGLFFNEKRIRRFWEIACSCIHNISMLDGEEIGYDEGGFE